MHLRNLWFLILLMFSTAAVATEKPIKVWPDEAPGEKGDLGAETATRAPTVVGAPMVFWALVTLLLPAAVLAHSCAGTL